VAQKKEMRAKKRYVNDTAVAVGKLGNANKKSQGNEGSDNELHLLLM